MHTLTFAEAVDDLNALVKSKRREQSIAEMSDSKDYDDEDLDDSDRRAQGQRRRDMRLDRERWAGIQAANEEMQAHSDAVKQDLAELRELLVSGRPSRIRFPGARGDSELRAFDREAYVEDDDIDEGFPEGRDRVRERNSNLRGALGGDSLSWRAQADRRGAGEDRYATGKSLGFRGRGFTAADLVKSFNTIKSRLSAAMWDEKIDPNILLNFEGASESHLGLDINAAMRALACVAPEVRRAYNIPTISGNQWEELGRIRRAP